MASREGLGARSKARMRAIELLFEAESGCASVDEVIERRRRFTEQKISDYTVAIVHGVKKKQAFIDELLETYSQGWPLERMPQVDRIALRVGAWELLFNDDVPDAVAIDEAVHAVGVLSTEESPQFVNGLLGRLQDLKPTLLA